MAAESDKCWILLISLIFSQSTGVHGWDSIDLELFDIVEEVKDNFYNILGLKQDASPADIRRAYRKLSLQLHPDKNKEPDAEMKFRQLVAVSEVLKDEEKRKRYDIILRDGLPDWRQPVFYYRRVRKMGLIEFMLLIFLILTIGHYIVAWSIYLEKKFELEELLFSKKKREDKKRNKNKLKAKLCDEDIPDLADMLVQEVGVSKPTLFDLLPFQVVNMLVKFCKSLPELYQALLDYWRERMKEKVENNEDDDEDEPEEQTARPRRRQRVNVPQDDEDDPSWEGAPVPNVINVNSDNFKQTCTVEKSGEWTDLDQSLLVRAMAKFPGGTPNRWEKIAVEIGRSVDEVTKQMKKTKQSYGAPVHSSNTGEGDLSTLVMNKKKAVVSDDCLDQADERYKFGSNTINQHNRTAKAKTATKNTAERPASQAAAGSAASVKSDKTTEAMGGMGKTVVGDNDSTVWSQNQQKQLELALQQYPKTVADRWTCIAQAVPGKTKEDCILRYKFLVECVRKKKQEGQK
ncbi:dnaJ homolog subfamily C member 1-like isoform X1 [Montipora foliosa]|uniref:dnaJ homolog subfamily C member 1-like isoform X1 n=1 Tax=Montipora foliosa TaxID=591990 RepID=UPI0035F11346